MALQLKYTYLVDTRGDNINPKDVGVVKYEYIIEKFHDVSNFLIIADFLNKQHISEVTLDKIVNTTIVTCLKLLTIIYYLII